MNYSDYQNQVSSEKITLAIVEASKRLIGFSVHLGSVYKLTNFSAVISSIEEAGLAYTEAPDLASVTARTYFYDEDSSTLYLETSDGTHPNGKFIALTKRLHFANVPIVLPNDLAGGGEVFYEPLIESTSAFGVEIDTVNQLSEAIEGSGTLTLINDQEFWPANYDKLVFENQRCTIYSYNRELPVSEARKLFDGSIEGRSYSDTKISLKLKDQLSVLREPIPLPTIQALNLRNDESLNFAKQRMILGQVFGHRPVNVDHVKDGYPVTGTVSIGPGDTTLVGTGTDFLAELSPDDELLIASVRYTIAGVASGTSLELTEAYAGSEALVGGSVLVEPDRAKRYTNRVWKIAGHALREPVTSVLAGSSTTRIVVESTDDLFDGDDIYVGDLGSGTVATIRTVISSKLIELSTSLETIPSIGTQVLRPAVQNVRINDIKLRYYRDYTLDAETATLTLSNEAEANVSPVRRLKGNVTTTTGSRSVTGTGFETSLNPGDLIGRVGDSEYLEVLSIESDTALTLRSPASAGGTSAGRYKPLIFEDGTDVLSCDVLGRTIDGTTDGARIKTVPEAVELLLRDMGLADSIDEESFTDAKARAYEPIGLVVPATYTARTEPSYRDTINELNRSVFGVLAQSGDFKFKYEVLRPSKPVGSLRLDEADTLSFKVDSTSKNMIKTATVLYGAREYNYDTAEESIEIYDSSSENAEYLLKTGRAREFQSCLINEADAKRLAGRWSFLLEYSTGIVTIDTKLQAASVEVGDIVDFTHRKLFERYGSTLKRKLMLVEKVGKSGSNVTLECTDLSNAFNRVAIITEGSSFADSDDEARLYGGFITDEYGLIDNEPETFGQNVIW